MSTVTRTAIVCDYCGAESDASVSAHAARDRASEAGWGRIELQGYESRRHRLEAQQQDICPDCLLPLTKGSIQRQIREVVGAD